MMNPTKCKRCGVATSGSADLCPRCLLELGLTEDPAPSAYQTHARARRPAPTPAELAPLFPDLELVRLVGQGGMGAVYEARQRNLGRSVALKVLLGDVAAEPDFARRFEREARTLASLSHPGCVVIHDFGERGGYYYLLMEYVDGANLRQLLATRAVSPREALSIVGQICDGLQYAHDQGVVHRDIKPENIIVTRDGRAKILDYGLAKLMDPSNGDSQLTGTLQAMGSVHYMAPEQWKNPLAVDHRADIYSLGVVFYELLTGELPVGRFPLPSQKVEVDVRLDEVVLKALEIDPELRWQHASEVKTRMAGLDVREAARPAAAAAAAAPAVARKKKSGIPAWVILLILLFIVGPVVLGLLALFLLAPVSLISDRPAEREIRAFLDAPPEDVFELESPELELPPPVPIPVAPAKALPSGEPTVEITALETYLGSEDYLIELGLSDSEAAAVTAILRDARRRYLAAEELSSTLSWDEEGRLQVVIDAFPEGERTLWADAWEKVRSEVADASLLPRIRETWGRWSGNDPWGGDQAVAGVLWRDGRSLHWNFPGSQGSEALLDGELRESNRYARFWKRGLELLEAPK